jgi:alpha-mannosidase
MRWGRVQKSTIEIITTRRVQFQGRNMQRLFVVSHTHWDREWYEPFQVFRLRLVECIDKLLRLFENDPEYEYFLLDGQTIVLEDYVEIRPDREQSLRVLVGAGKVQIGPWYVLPDEFLVSGESLIRNLMRGLRIAADFGGAMRIGYIPDPFGHVSQMPQILRGFGIGTAVFRRGLADEPVELWWEGADGTRVMTSYLRDSYDNIAWLPRDETAFVQGLSRARDSLAPHSVTGNLLMMNGTDHMEPWEDLSRLLRAARLGMPDVEIRQSSLPQYLNQVLADIARTQPNLPVACGELRNPKRHHLLPGVTSTRMWIKQRNAFAQTLLEKWAEPTSAYAALVHDSEPSALANVGILQLAWKYLLQNHPHDSICGCGADRTHTDMVPRFDWVEQIAGPLVAQNLAALVASMDTGRGSACASLVVFNPVAGPRTDKVIAEIELSGERDAVLVREGSDEEIACQIRRTTPAGNVEIEFVARDIPGYGYATFQIKTRERTSSAIEQPTFIENEFFRVEPNKQDGTLAITDKSTGTVYIGANRFVDGGDRGDLYNYCPPERDTLIMQPSAAPVVEVECGAVRRSMRIAMNFRLPGELEDERTSRSQQTVDEPLTTTVSLYAGVRRIDFKTHVDNRARDHRLRVEFPTTFKTEYASADQAFDVVRRPLDLPADTGAWIEQPRPEAPMQSWVSISDGETGLTLATRGLPEYEARKDAGGVTLALTLLRCTGWLSRGDLATRSGDAGPSIETPGAQEIGNHVFEYALIPQAGDWRNSMAEANGFAVPMKAVAFTSSLAVERPKGALPAAASFVAVEPGEFVITAIKAAEEGDGLIVRGYNIGEQTIEARVVLWREFRGAARVNLNEELIAPLELHNGKDVRLHVRAKEIVTLKFVV